ncbi:hypothetical protein AB0H83_51650 [Dactylosporangium sp. NPDC050688]|uniref:hypothetical protein n=1 Tax=Dactylosporangium sp. NPDC050688 TaxID=3157217 RepID=UPI0033FEF8DB
MKAEDRDKIDRYRRGETGDTNARANTEPIEVIPEVMVSRSLRLPADVFEELVALASAQGVAWSTLVRQWVIDGIVTARHATGTEVDPAIELQRGVAMITHAASRLQQRAA